MYCRQITLKSGQTRWECIADGPPDPATGKRNQIPRRGRTRKEAKQKVEEEIKRQSKHHIQYKSLKKITFQVAAKEWFEVYSLSGKKDSSLDRRIKDMGIVNQHLAMQPIAELTHFMYQKVINKLAKKYAFNTIKSVHSTANMIFNFAMKHWIDENPAKGTVFPKKKKTVEEIKQDSIEEKYLDREELEEFLKAAVGYGKKYDVERFYTLAFSGMRPGELCALKKSDLDFTENIIDINKTLYNKKNNMKEYSLTPPKTYKSVREVTMDPMVMDMLKKVVLANDKHKMKFRNKNITYYNQEAIYHDEDFLFARENGYPFTTISLNVRMNQLLKHTKIKKPATPHIFRHTHVSMLAEAGVDLPTIMERVGHQDSGTTTKIYMHVTKKMRKEAPAKVTNLYGNIIEKITF